MSETNRELEANDRAPEWLVQALQNSKGFHLIALESSAIASDSPEFQTRCLEAADAAFTLVRFSRQAQILGFIAVSFAEYLSGLAKLTRRPLETLLKHFGISSLDCVDTSSIRGLGSLWRELGFGLREALATLRLSLLPRDSGIQLLLARQRFAGGGPGLLEQCEALLTEIEDGIGCEYFEQLGFLQGELVAQYKSAPQDSPQI